jgi:hypothetical protein
MEQLVITALCNVNWSEALADRTLLPVPIRSVQIEVGYPDADQPVAVDGSPNLLLRTMGVPTGPDGAQADSPAQPARWTRDDPNKVLAFAFQRLAESVPGWDAEEVMLRKTISFDPSDPRVDLSSGGAALVTETQVRGPAVTVTAAEVGWLYIRFKLDRPIPNDAVTMALVCSLGERKDTFHITRANQHGLVWQLFSDKYSEFTSFTYELEVVVVGPGLQDEPVAWRSPEPVAVELPAGRIKFVDPLVLRTSPAPADKVPTINEYIRAFGDPPA